MSESPEAAVRPFVTVGVFAALVLAMVIRIGFVPMDEGFITAQSARLMRGEVPHQSFVSPRPVMSAVIHVVDLVLPTPLFLTSRAIAWMQIVAYTLALAILSTGRPTARWTPWWTAAVASAVLVNAHVFPLMAWHTVDGLMLSSIGFAFVRRGGSVRTMSVGAAFLGAAAMTKQSYAPALLVGLAVAWARLARDGTRRRPTSKQAAGLLLAGAAIPVAYLVWVGAAGGLPDMFSQLFGAHLPSNAHLWRALSADRRWLVTLVVGVGLIAAGRPAGKLSTPARVGSTAIVIVLSAASIGADDSGPATALLWFAFAACVLQSRGRHSDVDGLLVVSLGFMAGLSWGYASPRLVAGSLALVVLERTWRVSERNPRPARLARSRRPAAIISFVTLVALLAVFVDARRQAPYFDRPAVELGSRLGRIDGQLAGLWTNSSTAAYVEQMRTCLDDHPASRVAVLPDNAGLTAAFGLRNPFPVDWAYPHELVSDAHERLLERARTLAIEGDYLVLFQTVSTFGLAAGPPPPAVGADAPLWFWDGSGLMDQVRDELRGRRISCGSFVGNWSPIAR